MRQKEISRTNFYSKKFVAERLKDKTKFICNFFDLLFVILQVTSFLLLLFICKMEITIVLISQGCGDGLII